MLSIIYFFPKSISSNLRELEMRSSSTSTATWSSGMVNILTVSASSWRNYRMVALDYSSQANWFFFGCLLGSWASMVAVTEISYEWGMMKNNINPTRNPIISQRLFSNILDLTPPHAYLFIRLRECSAGRDLLLEWEHHIIASKYHRSCYRLFLSSSFRSCPGIASPTPFLSPSIVL